MKPEFNNGRFFVSPILGCEGRCLYCYLIINNYKKPYANTFDIDDTIEYMKKHKDFVSGKNGTIISVGAWGDLFPSSNELRRHSIRWIKELLSLENPLQIMSKNELTDEEIDEITASIKYKNQLLYSTTIITFDFFGTIEKGLSDPFKRLLVLKKFAKKAVPINIMIKPFIPNITKTEMFIKELENMPEIHCVVGKLYVDEAILNNLIRNEELKEIIGNNFFDDTGQISCVKDNILNTYNDKVIEDFISQLIGKNIKVFKKSSCVNANILKQKNKNMEKYKSEGFCMNCGNCM